MADTSQSWAYTQERCDCVPQEAQSSGVMASTEPEVLMSVKHAQRTEVIIASSAQEKLSSDGELRTEL